MTAIILIAIKSEGEPHTDDIDDAVGQGLKKSAAELKTRGKLFYCYWKDFGSPLAGVIDKTNSWIPLEAE